jgi:hypothetical protein
LYAFSFQRARLFGLKLYVFFGVKKTRLIMLSGFFVYQPQRPSCRSAHQGTIEKRAAGVNLEFDF